MFNEGILLYEITSSHNTLITSGVSNPVSNTNNEAARAVSEPCKFPQP